MTRFARIDPQALAPRQVLAIVEGDDFSASTSLLQLTDTSDVDERSWYLATEGGFIDPPPSVSHVWVGDSWVLDPTLDQQVRAEAERAWRDQAYVLAFSLRDRHRDEMELGIATTLTAEQFAELLRYIQLLRAWPQSSAFPDLEQRPVAPPWITEQTP
jgi:hypothetical protein